MEAYISFGLTMIWITPSLQCFQLIFFGKNLGWMHRLGLDASRADLGATSVCVIQASTLGEVEEKNPVSLAIINRVIFYFVALAEEQRCHGKWNCEDNFCVS